eukprot:CAMPEP_0172623966 /NCGR_PEP_ID=MMETSP1068-20121228/132942_1 /TAXON_ID=35684 /ORGANISM="Pseudopedinella elastica, Strain CCMP716" /LENGTH=63 /DNA_ID=CAMNT_0013432731 /DNA_START=21 /DNA_END=209 /DNA_ORIENTATION=+
MPFFGLFPQAAVGDRIRGVWGKPGVLLETYALVLHSASAVAEAEGIRTLMGENFKDSRDYTAQ